MNDQTQQLEKVTRGLIEACDEVNANCCKSVDAMVEATSVASKGCEEFSRKLGSLVQESVTQALGTGKTMLSAKNLQELTEMQTEFVKSFFDSWMSGAGRLTQISTRVTQEALEPVMKHANDTMSKVTGRAQQNSHHQQGSAA
jgi:phasin family protein